MSFYNPDALDWALELENPYSVGEPTPLSHPEQEELRHLLERERELHCEIVRLVEDRTAHEKSNRVLALEIELAMLRGTHRTGPHHALGGMGQPNSGFQPNRLDILRSRADAHRTAVEAKQVRYNQRNRLVGMCKGEIGVVAVISRPCHKLRAAVDENNSTIFEFQKLQRPMSAHEQKTKAHRSLLETALIQWALKVEPEPIAALELSYVGYLCLKKQPM
jgi:hypothetical protein